MPSDNFINIKACNWNGWCHSGLQGENHPKSFHEAFFSVLTFLSYKSLENAPSLWQDNLLAASPNIYSLV